MPLNTTDTASGSCSVSVTQETAHQTIPTLVEVAADSNHRYSGNRIAEVTRTSGSPHVTVLDLLNYDVAQQYVPTLKEIDCSTPERGGIGFQECVRWYRGCRPFRGSPNSFWPSPEELILQFKTAHKWASQIVVPSGSQPRDFTRRFSALYAIGKYVCDSCPQQYRNSLQGILNHATDMDQSRGTGAETETLSCWYDRWNVNRNCAENAKKVKDMLHRFMNEKRLSEDDAGTIEGLIDGVIASSKRGRDGLGESHQKNGRQCFQASEKLKQINSILKMAGVQVHCRSKPCPCEPSTSVVR